MEIKNNKTFLVAKREYLKTIRSKAFWFSIIVLPLFVFVIGLVSGYSSKALEDKLAQQAEDVGNIYIVDQADIINEYMYASGVFIKSETENEAIEKVKNNEIEAVIIYSSNIYEDLEIQIHAQDQGLIEQGRYNELAKSLVKESIISEIQGDDKQKLIAAELQTQTTNYKDGKEVEHSIEKYIIPIGFIAIYFVIFILISNFLLSSISEEKENRMIETILSIISPKNLIWGKIIGFTLIVITQIIVLVTLSIGAIFIVAQFYTLPIDFSKINYDFWQIFISLYFTITGFLFAASIMVGIGSAMPTYKEAGQLSPIFVIMSISPVYIATALVAEPNGTIAVITSYIPFTAPIVMLFRNAVDALQMWELILIMCLMVSYIVIGFYLAFKLFEIGSLEYSEKISLKRFLQKNKKHPEIPGDF